MITGIETYTSLRRNCGSLFFAENLKYTDYILPLSGHVAVQSTSLHFNFGQSKTFNTLGALWIVVVLHDVRALELHLTNRRPFNLP